MAVVVVAAALGAGCIIPRGDPDCPETTDCEECLESSGCGYCADPAGGGAGECMAGTSFGADDESACLSRWRFESCTQEGADCWLYSDCASCVEDEGCGWCASESACLDVGGTTCDMDFELSECSGGDCSSVQDSSTCESLGGCCWSSGYGACYRATDLRCGY